MCGSGSKGVCGRWQGQGVCMCVPAFAVHVLIIGASCLGLSLLDTHCYFTTNTRTPHTHIAHNRNKFGQLGLGHTNDEVTPRVVEALAGQPVSLLSCGWRHTLAVTAAGEVYAWGRGVNGELLRGREGCLSQQHRGGVVALVGNVGSTQPPSFCPLLTSPHPPTPSSPSLPITPNHSIQQTNQQTNKQVS